jgi:hypothetical protein
MEPDELIPVYCLARIEPSKLEEVQSRFRDAKDPEFDNLDNYYFKPALVPWSMPHRDGVAVDIWRLYENNRSERGTSHHTWMVDRQGLEDLTMLLVTVDYNRQLYSIATMAEINSLLKEHESIIPVWDNDLSKALAPELRKRVVYYTRVPARRFRLVEEVISKKEIKDVADFHDEPLLDVKNPRWDTAGFIKKAEHFYRKNVLKEEVEEEDEGEE